MVISNATEVVRYSNSPQKHLDEPGDEGMMPNNKFKWLTQFLATDGAGAHKT
jgi:hypothetical protein